MNILTKLTGKTLVKNKVRTIVTIIGIILSAAMITAVTVSIASFQKYLLDYSIYSYGDWHGCFYGLSEDSKDALLSDESILSAAMAQELGYAEFENSNSEKPYVYVLGGDELFFSRMPIQITNGRLPETSSEIVLPERLLSLAKDAPIIGDTITLELGTRYLDGEALNQSDSFYSGDDETGGETLVARETRSYTVVGYYERMNLENYNDAGYMAITVWDDGLSGAPIDTYFLMKNPKAIYNFLGNHSDWGTWETNSDVLVASGVSAYSSFYSTVYGMAAILVVLIMFGSVSLIYNAFSISVSDRTKQFGLLSSIGATKRQIRHMVFTEAIYVSAVGIPIGILCGIAGMGITFHFIGGKISSIVGMGDYVSLRLTATVPAIIIAFVVAFITVLISAWVPSRRAMKLTAIDAIRQTADINIKPRTVKTSKLTYKLFGLEGAIASKQFKRNRSRYRATVISLFMSIVLFISASSFCRYLTDSVSDVFEEYDYDICYSFGDTPTLSSGAELTPDYAADVLSDTQGVTKVSFESHIRASIDLGAESLSKDAQQKLLTHGGDSELIYTNVASIYGVDDDTFRQYLKEQGLRESDYFDESSPLAVVMSEQSLVNYDTERIEKTQVLDESLKSLTIPVFSDALYKELYPDETKTAQDDLSQCYVDLTVNIGAHVTELPFGLNRARHYNIIIVYPLSTFRQVVSDSSITSTVYFKTDGHKAAMDALTEKAKDAGIPTTPLYDVYATSEVERNIVLIVKVFSYGFITLISLISLANVFNTISTNIMLRRREFAMLKSVGMTSHGFNKMMNFECILYGVKSLIYGIPVAFILTYLMFRTVSSGYDADFYLPWSAVITVIVSVFAVVFATMMYSMRKIKQENPIDALKLETT